MKIQINAAWEVSEYLQNMIYKKLDKLNTFHKQIINVEVYLKLKQDKTVKGKIMEVNLHIPHKNIFAKDSEESYEKALAKVLKKLERQLKKTKAQLSNH